MTKKTRKQTILEAALHCFNADGIEATTIEAIRAANPIVLEPIVNVEITAPESATGDITGDLSSRRAQVAGTDAQLAGMMVVRALAPMAELMGYQSRLNALTSGQGRYTLSLSHYEAVPPNVQQQLAGQHKLAPDD